MNKEQMAAAILKLVSAPGKEKLETTVEEILEWLNDDKPLATQDTPESLAKAYRQYFGDAEVAA